MIERKQIIYEKTPKNIMIFEFSQKYFIDSRNEESKSHIEIK